MRKTALITGGSSGIGAAIALTLARNGFDIVIGYDSNADEAEALAESINASDNSAARTARGDISVPETASAMFEMAKSNFGTLDVLVNSAGILVTAPLAEIEDTAFARILAVNVTGTFLTMREAARQMAAGGRIINITSTTLALNAPGYAAYNASKGAIEGMTRVVAKELGPRGITVNAVAPGPVATDFFLRGKSQEFIDRMAAMAPAGRLGQPDDIAPVVAFLASEDAGWVNGQIIRVNGGIA